MNTSLHIMHRFHRAMVVALVLAGVLAGRAGAASAETTEVCLNGEEWTFKPVRVPFFGYEQDAPGRWLPPQRSHQFIVDAISDPANDWTTRHRVRVPMAWSSATSDPGSRAVTGDFAFPYFWQYVHRGVYERDFTLPAGFAGRRIKLWFESVNFRCWVYVNDRLVRPDPAVDYSHENKLPFELDVTDYVEPGSSRNRLRIEVHDFTASFAGKFPDEDHPVTGGTYPLGDRCDYYNKDRSWRNIDSGLIGDVLLRAVPEVNVADIFVRPSVSDSRLTADITLRNEGAAPRTVRLRSRVTEWRGGRQVLAFASAPEITLEPGATTTVTVDQAWPQPHLWWPHDPFLHVLHVELEENGRPIGRRTERFGFREVKLVSSPDVDVRGFYLNGVRVRLLGESIEPTWKDGYTEGVGTSGLYLYNPEYWSMMLDEAKRLNISLLRTHRGMWLPRMFEIADEKGMLMIASSTINNGNHKGGNGTPANQRRAVRDMIRALRNHPSVVIWELANESPYDEIWADEARRHDQTRPFVATQTTPRNHPSPSLAAASGSYAMGLSGYEPNIYRRHHKNWVEKPMYIYEDNACYDQPTDAERLGAVQQGLTIFRGHRSSGYEIVDTFYTWQKVYGQPERPDERWLKLSWRPEEVTARGYRPDFARLPLLDPWTDRTAPRIIRPLRGQADELDAFWQRSYSPIAVFDRDYDERLDIVANPYVAALKSERVLTVHNDDLTDLSTRIHVAWTVATADGATEISRGDFTLTVPLGGVREHPVALGFGAHDAVRVTYSAIKSGRERFQETISLRAGAAPRPAPDAAPSASALASLVMPAVGPGVESKGYRESVLAGSVGAKVLLAEQVRPGDFVQFNPRVENAGDYLVFLHVPPGAKGTLEVEIRHDTLNATVTVDQAKGGWVPLTASPVHLEAGALQNSVRIGSKGSAQRVNVDSLKLVRMK
jgi:hypothetical protein